MTENYNPMLEAASDYLKTVRDTFKSKFGRSYDLYDDVSRNLAAEFLATHSANMLNAYDWLQFGIAQGWCSQIVCDTHDGLPQTEEEQNEWEEGGDPCIPGVRMWGAEQIL